MLALKILTVILKNTSRGLQKTAIIPLLHLLGLQL